MPNTPVAGDGMGAAGLLLRPQRQQSILAPIDNLLATAGSGAAACTPPKPPRRPNHHLAQDATGAGPGSPATPAQPRVAAAPSPLGKAAAAAAAVVGQQQQQQHEQEEDEEDLSLYDVEDPLAESLHAAREALRDPGSAAACEAGGDGADGAPLGREEQHARLTAAISAFADEGRGQALYVSGLPGTGKSHTVRRALRALDFAPGVTTLWVNCMAVSSAAEVYGRIYSALLASGGGGGAAATPVGAKRGRTPGGKARAGGFAPAEQAAGAVSSISYEKLLAALSDPSFGGAPSSSAARGAKRRRSGAGGRAVADGGAAGRPVAIVLDEVDALVSKGQQGVYELFMLPHHPGARALVVGIANSIDLTERALPALKLRGCTPTLVAFPAYTTAQVSRILKACLDEAPDRCVSVLHASVCFCVLCAPDCASLMRMHTHTASHSPR